MATDLNKESAAQLYLIAVIMSFISEGGTHALGQKTGEYMKFLLKKYEIDKFEFEDLLLATMSDACEMFPLFVEARDLRKRNKQK